MRKIINDLIYDTNKAILIDEFYDSFFTSFLNRYTIIKRLFLTNNGRFFLHIYEREFALFSYNIDENIKPLSKNEAYEYMKEYCPEKIEQFFKLREA